MKLRIFHVLAILNFVPLFSYEYTYKTEKINENNQRIAVTVNLEPHEYLYKDSFLPSVNTPHIKLSGITVDGQTSSFFDKAFKAQKEGYKDKVSFTFEAQKDPKQEVNDALIHTHFNVSSTQQPQEKTIALKFSEPTLEQAGKETTTSATNSTAQSYTPRNDVSCEVPQPSLWGNFMQRVVNSVSTTVNTWKQTLTSLFTSTGSRFIRILAALILGILLSLTPCIYPMIPITVGILQANTSKSPFRNFLLASSYTLGISLTFALLGFIAALGSCVFGEMQGSPWIVVPIAAILFYFGGSMFGFYEMYIPRFLQPKSTQVKGGSFLSAFLFGAISGTIASPCLSPGLALILNYVASISTAGSLTGYIEGFILLFFFGIGSSLPLLIIGTFSSSMNMLPRAGMWMVEVKKIFGIMLMGMGFYHLSHLEKYFPWYILVWIIVASLLALGIYYFMSVTSYDSKWVRRYKSFMGTLFIVLACIMAAQGYKATHEHFYPQEKPSIWLNDYTQVVERAKKEHKRLFIDIGATYCGACKSLDRTIFHNDRILKVLQRYIPLKLDSDVHTTDYEEVKKLYGSSIAGFPTYLIVDPTSNQVIKKWGVEIEELGIEKLVQELDKLAQ